MGISAKNWKMNPIVPRRMSARWLRLRRVTSLSLISTRPGGRLVEAADHLQKRGLAGAGRTDQRGEFAVLDAQVHASQRLCFHFANFIYTGDIFNFYDFHFVLLDLIPPGTPSLKGRGAGDG